MVPSLTISHYPITQHSIYAESGAKGRSGTSSGMSISPWGCWSVRGSEEIAARNGVSPASLGSQSERKKVPYGVDRRLAKVMHANLDSGITGSRGMSTRDRNSA